MRPVAIVAAAAVVALLPAAAFMGMLNLSLTLASGSNASCSSGGTTEQPALDITGSNKATSVKLNATQLQNASAIVSVGRSLSVPPQGIEIALMVGLQESGLKNLANTTVPESQQYPHDGEGADHNSVGIFQQRPGGWGTVQELMTPTYEAQAFFGGPTGPNHGSPRGLLDVANWQTRPLTVAAQTVQVSAYPSAYAKWQSAAETILSSSGVDVTSGGGCITQPAGNAGTAGSWTAPNGRTGQDLINYAEQFVGKVPYTGACGDKGSPTGWCCTGFVYYMYHEVFGIDLNSGVVSGQLALAHQIPQSQAQPGDLIAWVGYHIGIYDGKGGVIHSPDYGRFLTHTNYLFDVNGVHPTFWRVNALGSSE